MKVILHNRMTFFGENASSQPPADQRVGIICSDESSIKYVLVLNIIALITMVVNTNKDVTIYISK